MKCFRTLLFAILIVNALAYSVVPKLSFSSPFRSFNTAGNRVIEGWNCGGDSMINEYFIRLTPDRQSKNGHCWSTTEFTDGEWVTTIKFRISGQGATLFGDGFSVFFSQSPSHRMGKMYGTNDVFYGFAVVFSTFKNSEFSRYHRDIALYVGDGEKGTFIQDQEHPGCYTRYRFHEKRQDFSVDNYAVVKIGYSASTGLVRVFIDEKNNGKFHSCLEQKVDLRANWWRTAHMGISATTGQLADNHDILAVETVVGEGNPDKVVESPMKKASEEARQMVLDLDAKLRKYGLDRSSLTPTESSLLRVMGKLHEQEVSDLNKLNRELEHTLVAVDDSLNNMIKKLREREDVSEGRITELEMSLKNKMKSSITSDMEARLQTLEKLFEASVEQEVKKSGGKWIVPFVLLLVALAIVLGISYNKYRYLQKAHILMQGGDDSVLHAFYSSVVKEVIGGIIEDNNGIDDSTAELIKEAWLVEYAKVSGKVLDLDHEIDYHSEEDSTPMLDINNLNMQDGKLLPIILSANPFSFKIPGNIAKMCPDILPADNSRICSSSVIPQLDGQDSDDSSSEDYSPPRKVPVIIAKKTATKPSQPSQNNSKPTSPSKTQSSFFSLSSVLKPVSITQAKSYTVLTSLSTIPTFSSSRSNTTRFKPKASQASAIRPLSAVQTTADQPSGDSSTSVSELASSTMSRSAAKPATKPAAKPVTKPTTKPVTKPTSKSTSKLTKSTTKSSAKSVEKQVERAKQAAVEVKEKEVMKPTSDLKALYAAENKRINNRMSEQSRLLIQSQLSDEGTPTIVLSRHDSVKHYPSKWTINLLDGIVQYKNQEILFGKSSCNFSFE